MKKPYNKKLAPIVLFTYNRPWHTQQTIEALQKNELAQDSELFIYSDGGKDEKTWQQVNQVREYLKTVTGFKNITLIFQEKNIGLADSIINGVTEIINNYGKIIVVEDDIVTSQYFLKFMNDALNFYEEEDKVWHISGWNYPIAEKESEETFLWRAMNCWGWATWKNKWQYFEKNTDKLIDTFDDYDIYKFNLDGTYNFWSQVEANKNNKINTWAVYWYATIFKNNGLCLNPVSTFVNNIGFGKNATHTKSSNLKPNTNKNFIKKLQNYTFDSEIKESIFYINEIKKLLKPHKDNIMQKRFSDEDYKLLLNTPRFTDFKVKFLNKLIEVPDSASLRFLNHELFGLEVYKFKSNTDTPIIIDCGANIGISLIYFKQLYPKAKIIAFEPDKKIYGHLKFNINSFGYNDIKLVNKGLWKEETTLRFYSDGADGGRIANQDDQIDQIIEIETVKLSDYLKKEKQIDLLKIDIEGAETDVLIECKEHLNKVNNIFIEYHSFIDSKQTLSTILNILEDNSFRYYIEHIGVKSNHPFINITNYVGFDNQLNIFGYKV